MSVIIQLVIGNFVVYITVNNQESEKAAEIDWQVSFAFSEQLILFKQDKLQILLQRDFICTSWDKDS